MRRELCLFISCLLFIEQLSCYLNYANISVDFWLPACMQEINKLACVTASALKVFLQTLLKKKQPRIFFKFQKHKAKPNQSSNFLFPNFHLTLLLDVYFYSVTTFSNQSLNKRWHDCGWMNLIIKFNERRFQIVNSMFTSTCKHASLKVNIFQWVDVCSVVYFIFSKLNTALFCVFTDCLKILDVPNFFTLFQLSFDFIKTNSSVVL